MKNRLYQIFKEVENNYSTITDTYKILEKTYEMGLLIHPAGQWLLDNMYIINQEYSDILEHKNSVIRKKLPTIKTRDGSKHTSIYYIAHELIEKNKGYTDQNFISDTLRHHQKVAYLTSEELNLFPLMLRISIIKFISGICLNIANSQIQKIEVEKILSTDLKDYDTKKMKSIIYRDLKMFKEDISNAEKLKDTNTSFVEYLASRLKGYGEGGEKFFKILNDEAEKIGFTVEEAIVKEHMEMAKTTDFMGKAILGLKQLQGLNFREIFESVNKIDDTLKQDYTNEFIKCDYKTKARYRNRVIKLSKQYNLSETYVAKKAVDCSIKYKKHVGFFLSGDEKYLLKKELGKSYTIDNIRNNIVKPMKSYIYVFSILIFALLITIFSKDLFNIDNPLYQWLYYIFTYIFAVEIVEKLMSYIIRKVLPPKILPRFDFAKTIDKEYSTYIVMPTVISSYSKIDTMIRKMEVTYLANRSENMYYMLLGDCIPADKQIIEQDEKFFKYAKEKLDILNKKYISEHPLFNFIYRKRVFSKSEDSYMGWERKRGALKHFNELVLGTMSKERINETMYLAYDDVVTTKYGITIDEDTELSLNTAKDLVAIIAHPLNTPKLSKNGKVVKSGHGLIQPAVGLDIEAANKSIFSKIFGGFGGLDIYTTAVSNTYQDLFNEAIFCGKGIYDIELFEKLLSNEIPDNLVLSHDLLEGSYMRAGLASDIQVQDGFPNNYVAYMKRNHRWYRGDIQIVKWLFSPKSPLNFLSKWKILDNIRRPMNDVLAILMIIISLFLSQEVFVRSVLVTFCVMNFGYILSLIDTFIYGRTKHTKEQLYIPIIHGVSATILTMTFDFLTLPYRAYTSIHAFTTSLFRMFISKKHLLEWTTAEMLEKSAKSKLAYYYYNMIPNLIVAAIILYNVMVSNNILFIAQFKLYIAIFFIISPLLAYLLGKSHLFGRKQRLNKMQDNEILDIAKRTWYFFDLMMSPVNNYLPTDNYQENRRYKLVNRTSSTNIGFGILAIINAYDLKFIKLSDCIEKIINIMGTINKLEKWNGHLLNWYNIKTLEPLRPRFVSTVDSGNFLACIYILKEFLIELKKSNNFSKEKHEILDNLINNCNEIIENTDFTKLYDMSRNLFTIGYAQDEGKIVDSYYDMLMSENRISSLLAIASRQITSKHWFALSRNLINVDGYKGLVSWSGTAFEYFMPYLFNKSYEHTLVDQSLFFAKYCQKKHAKSNNIPWGISESAFAVKDNYLNYQYQAFGIPGLGLKRGLKDYLVVSPYASLLMLEYSPDEVYRNIGKLKKIGAYGSFGFYESIDFTKAHLDDKEYEVVKTYMAHHQGMILTSINNYINSGIIKNRFHENPNIEACEILLKEREKIKANLKKDNTISDEAFKQKNLDKYTMYLSSKYSTKKDIIPNTDMQIAILKGKSLSTILTSCGASYIKYRDRIVNRQKYKDLYSSGNYIFLTDELTGRTFSTSDTDILNDPNSYIQKTNFSSTLSSAEYYIECGELESTTTVFLSPEHNIEVRKVSVYNNSNIKREVRINTYTEPAMTDYMTNVVHPSFNSLQIETYYDETLDILVASKRLKKEDDQEMYVYSKLIGIDLTKDVETEKSKIDFSSSSAVNAFDNNVSKYPLWPVLSFRAKIILTEHERQDFYYILGATDSKYKMSNAVINLTPDSLEKQFKLSAELNTVVSRYLKLVPGKAYSYNKIIRELIFDKKETDVKYWNASINQSMLWKYSISGDLPIMIVDINNIESAIIIDEVIDFMDYVKNRKIDIDIVVFVNNDKYSDKTYEYIKAQINKATYMDYTKGNIYLFNIDNIDKKDIELFRFICKKEISSIDPFLSSQQKPIETDEDDELIVEV
ncbi:MAG: glycosyl transferase family 36 [Clostridia bacterium]|nr:glycosyl transferase family 36 [Clostridia bacterium]